MFLVPLVPVASASHEEENLATWSKQTTANDGAVWWDVAWSPDLDLFAAVGGSGTQRVQTSPDGVSWTLRTTPNLDLFTIAWGGGIFCALQWTGVGNSQSIHSSNGVIWSSAFSGPNTMLARDMVYVDNLGAFVAVGVTAADRVWKSTDCENWTAFSSADDAREWYGLTYSPEQDQLVAVASTGTNTGRAMTSSDGESWTLASGVINVNHAWKGVAWSPDLELYAAVASTIGDHMNVMTSPDGLTWTARTLPFVSAPAIDIPLWAIVWVDHPTTPFFAAFHGGTGSTTSGSHSTPNVVTSQDGITWRVADGTEASGDSMEIALYEGAAWAPEINTVVGIVHTGTGSGEGSKKAITGVVSTAPLPPEGLAAVVTDGKTSTDPSEEGTIELRWPVSPDDPDQEVGVYEYRIFLNGVDVGADSTTSLDGDGVRFNQVFIGGTIIGSETSFGIKAKNLTSGKISALSCVVVVDTSQKGDLDSCGDPFPGSGFGLGGFTTPTDTAAGLAGFCSSLMGDSAGSLFLCGLILVAVAFLALASSFAALIPGGAGSGAAIAGSIAAFGMMIFNVFATIWSIVWGVVLIMLTAAVITAVLRRTFAGQFGGGATDG